MPAVGELVGDEPVAERRVVVVDVERGVDQVRVVPVAVGDRVGASTCRTPAWRSRAPGRSPRRGSRRRQGHGPAGTSFWEDRPGRSTPPPGAGSRSPARACRLRLLQLAQLRRLRASVTPGRTPSSMSASFSQRCRHDSEIPKSFAICASGASPLRATATTSRRNSGGNAFGMIDYPSSEDQILTGQESTEPGAVPSRPQMPLKEVTTSNSPSPQGSSKRSPPLKSQPGERSVTMPMNTTDGVEARGNGSPAAELDACEAGPARNVQHALALADLQLIEYVEVHRHRPRVDQSGPIRSTRPPTQHLRQTMSSPIGSRVGTTDTARSRTLSREPQPHMTHNWSIPDRGGRI